MTKLIGPKPCQWCGGEYGEHREHCIKPASHMKLPKIERPDFDMDEILGSELAARDRAIVERVREFMREWARDWFDIDSAPHPPSVDSLLAKLYGGNDE